jgi:hypothetical protein
MILPIFACLVAGITDVRYHVWLFFLGKEILSDSEILKSNWF